MKDINIQAKGFILNEDMRMNIQQSLHSVFGFNQYDVQKIVITLFNKKELGSDIENHCQIEVKIRNQPKIITELKSFDVFKATTLAIERAHLKTTRRSKDRENKHKHHASNEYFSSFNS